MHDASLQALLESSGAIRRGHFVLTSGRHSDVYFEKFRVLERPEVLSRLCTGIAEHFQGQADVVAGPTTGGILVACETARQMGLPALYFESEAGRRTLRRGAVLEAGRRVLVVDDVLTTGTSVLEVADVVRSFGGEVVGFGVLILRAEVEPDLGAPLFATHRVEAVSFAPDHVPEWLSQIPMERPGTRILPPGGEETP